MKFCANIVLLLCLLNCQRLVAKYITAWYHPLPFHLLDVPHITRTFVDDILDCGFACLGNDFCVSFNMAVFPDSKGKRWCELLSHHFYNNTKKLIADTYSHHIAFKNPCTRKTCSSHGICSPISFRDRIYKCVCYPGYQGNDCEIAPVECGNHSVLSEPDRHTWFGLAQNSDRSLVPGWYRFQSNSYTKMLDHCVGYHRCGTAITGFLNGPHPLLEDGIVNREACFHGFNNCCFRKVQIKVRRCDGFYVYYLNPSPPAGSHALRYCAMN